MVAQIKHLTMAEVERGLDDIRESPKDEGILELIVRRPKVDARELLEEGELSLIEGLVGDSWSTRGSSRTADGSAHREMQINIMNSRVSALVSQAKDRWALAGDQLYIDMDLSDENLPAGTRLALGSAVIEISALPHTGCKKFVSRFGLDAMRFVNSPLGLKLHLRGVNAKVLRGGVIRVGDIVRKIQPELKLAAD